MGKKCCDRKCGLITVAVIGAILLIIGAIVVAVYGVLFEDILIQEMTIAEGTLMYETWSVVTTPTYLSFFMYNVTNPEAFLSQDKGEYVKPVLEELGPYVFKEFYVKDNISFLPNLNPEEVYFRQKLTLQFDPEMSKGKLDDQITTLNLIGASIGPMIDYNIPDPSNALYLLINKLYNDSGTELLFTKSAHDILFGFEDDLYTKIVELFADLGVEIPPTFGLFATMNDSRGWSNNQVFTGKKRPDLINVFSKYNGMSELPYWGTEYCNMLNGTDGTTTPPFMKKEEKVYFFVDDVCRSLYGTFSEEVTVKKIPAWKYTIPFEIFEAPSKNEDNACYCPSPDEPICEYSGAIPLQSCMAGAPALISLPHFLNGDDFYRESVDGVSPPNAEEHEVSLVYEPNTGQAIMVDKRLQISMVLRNNPNIDVLNQIERDVIFPVVWLNESALIGDSDASLVYGLIVTSNEVVLIIQIVLCIVGSILILVPLTFGVLYCCKKSNESEKLEMKNGSTQNGKFKSNNNKGYDSDTENTYKNIKSF